MNPKNKVKFIELLTFHLRKFGCIVIQSEGDADLLIAKEGIKYGTVKNTKVIGEDTDILILLLYHMSGDVKFDLKFQSDKLEKCYDIQECQNILGDEVCKSLLFLHAITGCDTMSSLFNIGKLTAFKKMMNNKQLRDIAHEFSVAGRSQSMIEQIGEKAIKILYNCDNTEKTSQKLRHEYLLSKVITAKSFVKSEYLPPTSSSAKYHSHRTYFQVQDWISDDTVLNPEEWGWKKKNGELFPITNDQNAAPASIMKVMRCNCRTECLSKTVSHPTISHHDTFPLGQFLTMT